MGNVKKEVTPSGYDMLTSDAGRVMFIGDLHISDVFQGSHVNYLLNCFEILEQLTYEIIKYNPTHIVLTGDVVGVNEQNFKQRQTLYDFQQLLRKWSAIATGGVYSVRGNHDMGRTLTDFEIFVGLGFIKHVPDFTVGALRVHLVDYGEIHRPLNLTMEDEYYHIAVTHDDIRVAGSTTWMNTPSTAKTYELSGLKNFKGVQYVIAGHIHTPSERFVTTAIEGEEISLFYPGNPTRVKKEPNLWNTVFLFTADADQKRITTDLVKFPLKPHEEIFKQANVQELDEELEEAQTQGRLDILADVLGELKKYDFRSRAGHREQIKMYGKHDPEAVELAFAYMDKVEEELRS